MVVHVKPFLGRGATNRAFFYGMSHVFAVRGRFDTSHHLFWLPEPRLCPRDDVRASSRCQGPIRLLSALVSQGHPPRVFFRSQPASPVSKTTFGLDAAQPGSPAHQVRSRNMISDPSCPSSSLAIALLHGSRTEPQTPETDHSGTPATHTMTSFTARPFGPEQKQAVEPHS